MRQKTPVLVFAILLVATSCEGLGLSRRSPSAREAIATTYKSFEDAFFKGDASAIGQAFTDDAEWYVPEAPPVKGRSAIGLAWKEHVGRGGKRLRFDVAEVEENGERAHEVGRFTISAADGDVLAAGKYIAIWARQPDGGWKTYRDIYNWDIPPRRP